MGQAPSIRRSPFGRGVGLVVRATGCPAQLWCIAARMASQPAQGFALCDMRWIKPLDTALIRQQLAQVSLLVSLEGDGIMGGAGSRRGRSFSR